MFKSKTVTAYPKISIFRRTETFNNCKFKPNKKQRNLKSPNKISSKIKDKDIITTYKSHRKQTIFDKLRTQIKRFLVDTSISVIWSFTFPGIIEYFVVGLTFEQTLKQRIAMTSFALIFGRTYGSFRDWFTRKVKTDKNSSSFRKYATDTFSNILFYTSAYSIIMAVLTKPSLTKAISSIGLLTFIGLFVARIYTRILDYWRKLWDTNPTLNK